MIVKGQILNNLKILEKLYNKTTGGRETLLYSKLAILELCGWVEESMDDIALNCAKRYLKNPRNLKYIEDEVIKPTSGFDYKTHFRSMLMKIFGLINFERIEKKVDPVKRTKLESTLSSLKKVRNPEAHTHIKGATRSINAPSITKSQFIDVYDGLIEFDRVIKNTKI